jgi:hypothetical protein
VPDVLADPEFDRFEWQKIGKQRTVLGVRYCEKAR